MDRDESSVPDLISDSESGSDDHDEFGSGHLECIDPDSDDEQMNMLSGDVCCLFCTNVDSSVEASVFHCKTVHHFDLPALCQHWCVDSISYIKMVNFCRRENPSPERILQGLMSGGVEWQEDKYMQAVDSSDLMLQYDVESLPICTTKEGNSDWNISNNYAQDINHLVHSSEAVVALAARVKAVEGQRDILKDELDRAIEDLEKLKLRSHQFINLTAGGKEKKIDKHNSLNDEDGYFASYSHHGIHMTMLKDEVRTKSYRDFMLCNRHLFEGKTVLDVGCGTGILSMFAVQAGAKQVVAVDSSQIIYQAMDIARENNMHEKITFVKGKLEDVQLPFEKFDVIISEWMGYFLLFEAMLDSVLWARDHCLAPGGCVYPDYFTMNVVGINNPELYQQTVGFWDDVYGFKMSCMKGPVLDEVQVCTIQGEMIVTEAAVIKEIDVNSCKVADLDFCSEFSLLCKVDGELTAVVGYFDTYFDQNCQSKIHFSTGPNSIKTHWEQAVMILSEPLSVKKGSSILCKLTYRKHPGDSRGIIINLTVGHVKQKYSLW